MAGADIEELSGASPDELKALIDQGHKALARLEALPCPTVAVIHGTCLGGGLEVALACDHRVADHSASFGFPEVQLGLHPGLGGTERFPRLVEPATALQLMLTGKTIDARKAKQIGLVRDAVTVIQQDRADAAPGQQRGGHGLEAAVGQVDGEERVALAVVAGLAHVEERDLGAVGEQGFDGGGGEVRHGVGLSLVIRARVMRARLMRRVGRAPP